MHRVTHTKWQVNICFEKKETNVMMLLKKKAIYDVIYHVQWYFESNGQKASEKLA